MIIRLLFVVMIHLVHSLNSLQSHVQFIEIDHNVTNLLNQGKDCFVLEEYDKDGELVVVQVQNIQPYIKTKLVCFIIKRNVQNNQSKKLYLRVDYMPNQCLNIKNDVPFIKLSVQHFLNNFTDIQSFADNSQILIASLNITRQCANLSADKSSNNQFQQQPIKLIIEPRQVIYQLFGFPVYRHPFTELLYFLITLILVYVGLVMFNGKIIE